MKQNNLLATSTHTFFFHVVTGTIPIDRGVGKVSELVVYDAPSILLCAEPDQSIMVQIYPQRVVTRYHCIQSQVEFVASCTQLDVRCMYDVSYMQGIKTVEVAQQLHIVHEIFNCGMNQNIKQVLFYISWAWTHEVCLVTSLKS